MTDVTKRTNSTLDLIPLIKPDWTERQIDKMVEGFRCCTLNCSARRRSFTLARHVMDLFCGSIRLHWLTSELRLIVCIVFWFHPLSSTKWINVRNEEAPAFLPDILSSFSMNWNRVLFSICRSLDFLSLLLLWQSTKKSKGLLIFTHSSTPWNLSMLHENIVSLFVRTSTQHGISNEMNACLAFDLLDIFSDDGETGICWYIIPAHPVRPQISPRDALCSKLARFRRDWWIPLVDFSHLESHHFTTQSPVEWQTNSFYSVLAFNLKKTVSFICYSKSVSMPYLLISSAGLPLRATSWTAKWTILMFVWSARAAITAWPRPPRELTPLKRERCKSPRQTLWVMNDLHRRAIESV